jgi:hypothetical protein
LQLAARNLPMPFPLIGGMAKVRPAGSGSDAQ